MPVSGTERIDSRNLHPEDDAEDLKLWEELEENCEESPEYGITLVRKDRFTEYAQEVADETGAFIMNTTHPATYREERVDVSSQWPFNHIDWEAAAEDLAEDWFEVEYKDHTYLAR